jgi:hypothetical protein
MTRPANKLDYKRTGPYTVSKVIKNNAYKLDHLCTILKHNVFHVSWLDHYTPLAAIQKPFNPQITIVNDSDEWELDWLLDPKQRYLELHYLV